MQRLVLNLAALLALLGWSHAWGETTLSGEELLLQVDRNLYPAPFEQYLQLENHRPNGTMDKSVVYVAREASGKSILVVVSPDTLLGRSVFRDGQQAWTREPGILDPHEIGLSQTMLGGGFDYFDLLPEDFSSAYIASLKEEEDHVFLLELRPRSVSNVSPCASITMRVDKKLVLPVETICLGRGERELKRVKYKAVQQFGSFAPRPSVLETTSAVNRGYLSRLTIGRMVPRIFEDGTFSKEFLTKAGELLK